MVSETKFRDLLFARAYYFAVMGGVGFINPFINLFYVSLGLTGKQIGTFGSMSAIVGLIVSPVVVTEIKKLPQARLILQFSLIMGALGYFLIGQQVHYAAILVIIFFQTMMVSSISPTSDAMAVSVSQESGTGYGSIRVWASLGWIVTVLLSGALVGQFGFEAGFIGVTVVWTMGAGLLLFIQPRYFVAHVDIEISKPSLKTAFRHIFHDRTLLGFAVAVILIGFLNSGVLQFENVFLAQLGASKQLISVAGTLSAIVELPFMIFADRFVRRAGAQRMMMLALSMIVFQRLAVLVFPYIATIMLVRFIGGTSFSFYTIAYMGIISSRTKSSETGTVLALYTVTLAGLVNMLAAPLSGALFDAIGARWLYGFAAVGYALGVLVLWFTRPPKTEAGSPSIR